MSEKSRITPVQRAVLDRFTCERLTENIDNLPAAQAFECQRNTNLADILPYEAWEEDLEGRPTAYYVVKDPAGRIAMYFSLKCGVLFDPDYVRGVMERYERSRALLNALENEEPEDWAREFLDGYRDNRGFVPGWKASLIRSNFLRAENSKQDIREDELEDPSRKLVRVDEAFPAIELVHFCVNDAVRAEWKSCNMGRPIGECLFWHFVVPKMQEINRLIGCEYAYLFAADKSADGTLMNYYETALHFRKMQQIGTVKPEYDFTCVFMGARLSRLTPYRRRSLAEKTHEKEERLGLFDHREAFYENFNLLLGEQDV